MLERREIETRDARRLPRCSRQAFDEHCQTTTTDVARSSVRTSSVRLFDLDFRATALARPACASPDADRGAGDPPGSAVNDRARPDAPRHRDRFAPPTSRESAVRGARRSRPPGAARRRSVPCAAYRHRYQSPSAVSRLRSQLSQNGSVVEEMIPKIVPSGSGIAIGGRGRLFDHRRDRAVVRRRGVAASRAARPRAASTSASRRRRPCTR